MLKTLVLFSGLPGCGKTTLARRLAQHTATPLLAKDRVQRVLRDYVPAASGADSYYLLLDLGAEQLSLGLSVILDAVFSLSEFRTAAATIAAQQNALLRPIYCYCSDAATWRARVESRVQYVPGWQPADWAEVERVRAYFEPWPPGEALEVDALQPFEQNFAAIRAYLDN